MLRKLSWTHTLWLHSHCRLCCWWTQGEALRQQIGAKAYLECSAKMRSGVEEVFGTAVRVVVEEVERLAAPPTTVADTPSDSAKKKKKKHRFRFWLNK